MSAFHYDIIILYVVVYISTLHIGILCRYIKRKNKTMPRKRHVELDGVHSIYPAYVSNRHFHEQLVQLITNGNNAEQLTSSPSISFPLPQILEVLLNAALVLTVLETRMLSLS